MKAIHVAAEMRAGGVYAHPALTTAQNKRLRRAECIDD
jgi:hypothetical protein